MSGALNIAFFGSSLVSAYWNGAATYYRGIIKSLAARGHHITFYEPDAYERQSHRDIADPPWARVVVYEPNERDVWRVLREARDADVLIKTSGVGIFDELLEAAVLDVKASHTVTAFWDVDAPATLDRVRSNPRDAFNSLIPQYDLVLTYGGGPPVVDAYTRLGARYCVPIYNALDPDTHHPVRPEPEYAADLSLLANRLPDRETRIDEFFFTAAEKTPEHTFLLGGNGWQGKPAPANVKIIGHVFTKDHNAFNCSANLVLNVSRESMARYGYSPATRVFEAAGAAACLITDSWEGIELFFEPGSEILIAECGDDVAYYVKEVGRDRSELIGAAARKRVLAEHTYEKRVDVLEGFLDVPTKRTGRTVHLTSSVANTVNHD